ncbi:hypothetical protein [Halocola ammonii]
MKYTRVIRTTDKEIFKDFVSCFERNHIRYRVRNREMFDDHFFIKIHSPYSYVQVEIDVLNLDIVKAIHFITKEDLKKHLEIDNRGSEFLYAVDKLTRFWPLSRISLSNRFLTIFLFLLTSVIAFFIFEPAILKGRFDITTEDFYLKAILYNGQRKNITVDRSSYIVNLNIDTGPYELIRFDDYVGFPCSDSSMVNFNFDYKFKEDSIYLRPMEEDCNYISGGYEIEYFVDKSIVLRSSSTRIVLEN